MVRLSFPSSIRFLFFLFFLFIVILFVILLPAEKMPSLAPAELTLRCGYADIDIHVATTRYRVLPGGPFWRRSTLTYAFSPQHMIPYLDPSDVKKVFRRAFSRWAATIPLKFVETANYRNANIRIGWYAGDHGDGYPFDGPGGELAHAGVIRGRGHLHLDADDTWVLDEFPRTGGLPVHLESVVIHEIGHLLGLDHCDVSESVMYPYISPWTRQVDLTIEDVLGVQSIYGPNPDFDLCSVVY